MDGSSPTIDDLLSLNNCKFGDFVDHIYPTELEIIKTDIKFSAHDVILEKPSSGTLSIEIKDTTDTARSASYIDLLHLDIDSESRLTMKLYDKKI